MVKDEGNVTDVGSEVAVSARDADWSNASCNESPGRGVPAEAEEVAVTPPKTDTDVDTKNWRLEIIMLRFSSVKEFR